MGQQGVQQPVITEKIQMIVRDYTDKQSGKINIWFEMYESEALRNQLSPLQKKNYLSYYLKGEAQVIFENNYTTEISYNNIKQILINHFSLAETHNEINYELIEFDINGNWQKFYEKKVKAARSAGISSERLFEDLWKAVPITFKAYNLVNKPENIDLLNNTVLRAEDIIKKLNKNKFKTSFKNNEKFCQICIVMIFLIENNLE